MNNQNFSLISEGIKRVLYYFQEFTVGIMLYLRWHDSRLTNFIKNELFDFIELDSNNMANFWVPDIYFPNEKRASFHNVMTKNRMIRLHKNDSINLAVR